MITVFLVLALLALLIAVYSAVNQNPPILWVAVVLLSILEIIRSASPYLTTVR